MSSFANEAAFVAKREARWQRLRSLCDRADNSVAQLSGQEILELFQLYRKTSQDLSEARTQMPHSLFVDSLNDLCARAYAIVYRSPRKSFIEALREGVFTAARTVRKRQNFVYLSILVFVLGIIFTSTTLKTVPASQSLLVPEQMQPLFDKWKEANFEPRTGEQSLGMWAMYATHNPTVSIVTASMAASTFGVGTAQMLFQNGSILGSLGSEMASVGKLPFLISSIAPHGIPEMTGIIMAGAGGFVMAWALISPGRKSRWQALGEAGKDTLILTLTAVALCLIAAPIEGFFSFNPIFPQYLKAIVALIEIPAWIYLWRNLGLEETQKLAIPAN